MPLANSGPDLRVAIERVDVAVIGTRPHPRAGSGRPPRFSLRALRPPPRGRVDALAEHRSKVSCLSHRLVLVLQPSASYVTSTTGPLGFYTGTPELNNQLNVDRVRTDGSGVPEEIPPVTLASGARVVAHVAVYVYAATWPIRRTSHSPSRRRDRSATVRPGRRAHGRRDARGAPVGKSLGKGRGKALGLNRAKSDDPRPSAVASWLSALGRTPSSRVDPRHERLEGRDRLGRREGTVPLGGARTPGAGASRRPRG